MRPPWMDPDAPGPTAVCVTDQAARSAHKWASDVPGGPASTAVVSAHDEARYWCDRCLVKPECLAFAMLEEGRNNERDRLGVYGGMGPAERALLAGLTPKPRPTYNMPSKSKHAPHIRDVACPTCEQPAGQLCQSGKGRVTDPHTARVAAAEVMA